MPQPVNSPGAAATHALLAYFVEREAKRWQDMLDAITKSTAARQDEVARDQLALQTERLPLNGQREAATDLNRQKKALDVIGTVTPATIDAPTALTIREGGLGSLIGRASRCRVRCSWRLRMPSS